MSDQVAGTFEQAQSLHKAGHREQAAALYQQLLENNPNDVNALHFLGLLRYEQGRPAEAAELFEKVTRAVPDFPEGWAAMALCYRSLGKAQESLQASARALKLNPTHPIALNVRGGFLHQQGEYRKAAECFGRVLQADPKQADVAHNLGITLHFMGQPRDAIRCYRHALALTPDSAQLRYNLGLAQEAVGELTEAIESLEGALELQSSHLEASYRLAYLKRMVCDWDGLDDQIRDLEQRLENYVPGADGVRLSSHAALVLNLNRETHRRLARGYASLVEATVADLQPPRRPIPDEPARKLRIGYLSPDFGHHAIGVLVRDLFGAHDGDRFEVFTYSLRNDPHANLEHVRETSKVFRDVSGLSFQEAADRIAADGIHILVDLAGYTRDSRPEILALRPAPVQISWLGYLDTMGASFIDYLVADPIVVPPGEDDLFDEQIIRLPPCFMIASPIAAASDVPSRESLGLPAEGVVYASFNNSYKLDPELFNTWMHVLKAVPDSVLWLYPGKSGDTGARLKRVAQQSGVNPDRIVLADGIPIEQHLARQRHADIFLDAFQYSAGATGMAALMAGVPLLTLNGTRLLSRMGASMNVALGLEELTSETVADYEALAVRLGEDQDYRQRLRQRLAEAREDGALFDVRGFVARLERAYETVWARYAGGEKPGPISITD